MGPLAGRALPWAHVHRPRRPRPGPVALRLGSARARADARRLRARTDHGGTGRRAEAAQAPPRRASNAHRRAWDIRGTRIAAVGRPRPRRAVAHRRAGAEQWDAHRDRAARRRPRGGGTLEKGPRRRALRQRPGGRGEPHPDLREARTAVTRRARAPTRAAPVMAARCEQTVWLSRLSAMRRAD